MSDCIKELEDITRLMDVTEEGLNQVNDLIENLTRKRIGGGKLTELLTRAKSLEVNLEEHRQFITTSRFRFRI